MLKICHIITKLELGGAQQNTLYTVGHLDRKRFEPVLIAGKGGILDSEAAALPQVPTYFVASLGREINPFLDLITLVQLWRILRKERPQVVHTHSSKAGILGRWAARLAGVPVIIHTFHGFAFHDYQSKFVKQFYVLLERLTAAVTDTFIAVTSEDIQKGLAHGIGQKERYRLIRSGIDLSYYKMLSVNRTVKRRSLGLSDEHGVVTTIGPFKPQKNLFDFVRVAAMVSARVPAARFLIVGDGDQRKDIEALIGEMKLSGIVSLLGWRRDAGEILAASDLFVLTSLWEGLPRSILEAMILGLPVVANAVDGAREIVADGRTGYLVKPGDRERMAADIIKLLQDSALSRQMGECGRGYINNEYDINFMVRQQEDLYCKTY
jgi:glycosyltransferase involved in cell wall biosynthesis